jgi:hypothetical protein
MGMIGAQRGAALRIRSTSLTSISVISRHLASCLLDRPVAALLLLGGCHTLADPPLPVGTKAFEPPAVYSEWWTTVEKCSGITQPMSRVTWFDVPNTFVLPSEGPGVDAYWSAATNRIVVGNPSILSGELIRHEMLHAVLQTGHHRRDMFLDRCGGIVACSRECIRDAGPSPTFAGRSIPADSLIFDARVLPQSPSVARDSGLFALVISVTNPWNDSVIVTLPSPDAANHIYAYHLQGSVNGLGGWSGLQDSSVIEFLPGETKQQVFDFRAGADSSRGELRAGSYTVGAAFAGHWIYRPLTILP